MCERIQRHHWPSVVLPGDYDGSCESVRARPGLRDWLSLILMFARFGGWSGELSDPGEGVCMYKLPVVTTVRGL